MPTCWPTLTSADAMPASCGFTADITVSISGTTAMPRPIPDSFTFGSGIPGGSSTPGGGLRAGVAYVARSPGLSVPCRVGRIRVHDRRVVPWFGGWRPGTGRPGRTGSRPLVVSAAGMGISLVLAATAPNLLAELASLALVGSGSVA